MIAPIIVSKNNTTEALATLEHWFVEEPVTLLLVFGETDLTLQTVDRIQTMINSGDVFYRGVRVLQIPEITLVKERLERLNVNPRLQTIPWSEVFLVSITNVYHNVADFVIATKFTNKPNYYIERAIMKALSFDKQL